MPIAVQVSADLLIKLMVQ